MPAPLTFIYEWEAQDLEDPATTVISVCVRFSRAELDRQLAAYDPNSGTSPTVGDARLVLRGILNATLERQS